MTDLPYQWVTVNILVLYVIGWMRPRGRSPLVLFASLATPLLWLLGEPVSVRFVQQLAPISVEAAPGTEDGPRVAYSVLMVVLPVCIPVLVTGFARFRGPSVQTV